MNRLTLRRAALTALGLAAFAAAPAHAQDAPPPASPAASEAAAEDGGFDISATLTLVSDYRFRGVSLTNRDPAGQASVDISYHGFYAGAWTSNIARFAGTHDELDLYAGYGGEIHGFEYQVGGIAYLYPGGDGTGNIVEATGEFSYTLGPATGRLKVNYAPDQHNLAGDNLYLSADLRVAIPTTPITAFAQIGRERGSFYGRKADWSFGAEYTRGPFTASLGWFDTDLDAASIGLPRRSTKGGIVASLGFEF
jgi:uncharacterized protein (TIGR02001 family)